MWIRSGAALISLWFWLPAMAQEAPSAIRGPYLQIATPTSITVCWRTDLATDSRVQFGTDLANLDQFADDPTVTREHVVTLTGLAPETKYFYSIGTTTGALAGGDTNHFFVTSPLPGTARPTRVWVIGDSGSANANAMRVRDAYLSFTETKAANLWLMLGDNAYPSGTDAEYQAAVFDMYPTILRNTPLWPTIGNHDLTTNDYFSIFALPTAGEAGGLPSGSERYYSFDYANIHFICLESYATDRSTNGPMMTWLANDLAATTNFWVIAFWHHPPYSKGGHNSDIDRPQIEMRQNALPILEAHGVDLVLAGHSHSYERSKLIDGHYGFSTNFAGVMIKDGGDGREDGTGAYLKLAAPRDGAVYTVAGSSGALGAGPAATLDHPVMITNLVVLGSVVLDVDGSRLDATFIDDTATVRDYFTLIKGVERPPGLPFVDIAASDSTAAEAGLDPGSFVVTRTGSTYDGLVVNYSLAGSAKNTNDYAPLSGSVTIPPGATSAPIVVTPVDDSLAEDPETVIAKLIAGAGYGSGYPAATVTIADNDVPVVRGPYLQSASPTSIVVRWRTNVPSDSRVQYGFDPANLDQFVEDPAATTEHVITLAALTPDTKYFYSIGSTTSVLGGGDTTHFFFTHPLPGTAKPTRIWVLGDSGHANANAIAVRNAYLSSTGTNKAQVWLMLGDNAYNNGTDAEYQAAVFNMYPMILRNTPLWPTIGNHEGSGQTINGKTAPYFSMFTLPTAGEAGGLPSGTEAYYSFDHGNIHFICLESYVTDRRTNGPMVTWLANDLAATTNFWIIAYWHHPPYSHGSHNSDLLQQLIEIRKNLVPTLEAGGVDLVLCGHSHSYERSMLIDGHYGLSETFAPSMIKDGGDGREDGTGAYLKLSAPHNGTVYTVAGSGSSAGTGGSPDATFDHPIMVTNLVVLGSVLLDIDGPRLDAKFVDATGTVRDYFTLMKDGERPPRPTSVSIVASDSSASEAGPSPGAFTVARIGNTNEDLIISYTLGGSAMNTNDYGGLNGVVIIPTGATSAQIPVMPVDDSQFEGSETVVATLMGSANYILGSPYSATVTIADNDQPKPKVKVTVSDGTASEVGGNPGAFKIVRQGSQSKPLTVYFSLGGTAGYGQDYTTKPIPNSATIAAGNSSKIIRVYPINDQVSESPETVVLRLLPDGAYQIIEPDDGTVKILSNE